MKIMDFIRTLLSSADLSVHSVANRHWLISDLQPPDQDVSLGLKRLTSLADPLEQQDGATKSYVDRAVSASHTMRRPRGSVAEWVSGVATAAAVTLALTQLALQRQTEANLDREKQALQVTAWVGDGGFYVRNASDAPVYQLIVSEQDARFASSEKSTITRDFAALLSVAPPGLCHVEKAMGHGAGLIPSAQIDFLDTAGRYWLKNNRGRLQSINSEPSYSPPFDYCKPVDH